MVTEGFADELGKARKLGTLKQYVVGRSSEATFADAFAKQEEILRYLGNFDPNGQVDFISYGNIESLFIFFLCK